MRRERQKLQRDLTSQGEILGQVDLAHPSLPQFPQDPEVRKGLAFPIAALRGGFRVRSEPA